MKICLLCCAGSASCWSAYSTDDWRLFTLRSVDSFRFQCFKIVNIHPSPGSAISLSFTFSHTHSVSCHAFAFHILKAVLFLLKVTHLWAIWGQCWDSFAMPWDTLTSGETTNLSDCYHTVMYWYVIDMFGPLALCDRALNGTKTSFFLTNTKTFVTFENKQTKKNIHNN